MGCMVVGLYDFVWVGLVLLCGWTRVFVAWFGWLG